MDRVTKISIVNSGDPDTSGYISTAYPDTARPPTSIQWYTSQSSFSFSLYLHLSVTRVPKDPQLEASASSHLSAIPATTNLSRTLPTNTFPCQEWVCGAIISLYSRMSTIMIHMAIMLVRRTPDKSCIGYLLCTTITGQDSIYLNERILCMLTWWKSNTTM